MDFSKSKIPKSNSEAEKDHTIILNDLIAGLQLGVLQVYQKTLLY